MSPTIKKDTRNTSVATADLSSKEMETTDHQNSRRNAGERKDIALIRVLLVDDHALMRAGLRQLLSLENDITVVGEACDGFDALQQIGRLQPTVVLLDINMPVIDGIALTRQISHEFPDTAVIILTMHRQQQHLFQAIKNGAKGYLLKTASIRQVTDTIRKVSAGGICINTESTGTLVNEYRRLSDTRPFSSSDAIELLTEKEQEIIRHVADGMSNKEIADKLVYSEKTVKNYLSIIFQKLNLRDRTQVAIFALRHGLVPEQYV